MVVCVLRGRGSSKTATLTSLFGKPVVRLEERRSGALEQELVFLLAVRRKCKFALQVVCGYKNSTGTLKALFVEHALFGSLLDLSHDLEFGTVSVPFTLRHEALVARQVAEAVVFLASRGLRQGDLRAANILVFDYDHDLVLAKLADFEGGAPLASGIDRIEPLRREVRALFELGEEALSLGLQRGQLHEVPTPQVCVNLKRVAPIGKVNAQPFRHCGVEADL
jgi:serine/threonine protein kinase